MEVADDGNAHAGHDVGDRLRRRLVVDGDPHQLAAGVVQRTCLRSRRTDVRRIRVGHRLDDDRMSTAHLHAADVDDDGPPARTTGHATNITATGVRDRERPICS